MMIITIMITTITTITIIMIYNTICYTILLVIRGWLFSKRGLASMRWFCE